MSVKAARGGPCAAAAAAVAAAVAAVSAASDSCGSGLRAQRGGWDNRPSAKGVQKMHAMNKVVH